MKYYQRKIKERTKSHRARRAIVGILGGGIGFGSMSILNSLGVRNLSPEIFDVLLKTFRGVIFVTAQVVVVLGIAGVIAGILVDIVCHRTQRKTRGVTRFVLTGIGYIIGIGFGALGLGGISGYLSNERKYRKFLMFAIPSFLPVPRFKSPFARFYGREYLDDESKEVGKNWLEPDFALTAAIIIPILLGMIESIKASFWAGIPATFLGVILGVFELMIIGTLIRLFSGLMITPEDMQELWVCKS